jgi:DNA-binding CsgD family transcriptional regulator
MRMGQGQVLDVLQRLGSCGSIESFQRNLLEELRSVLPWDDAVSTSYDLPPTCPSGLWDPTQISCPCWQHWSQEITKLKSARTGLLLLLNLQSSEIENSVREDFEIEGSDKPAFLGVLLLRRDRLFEPSEIQTLTQIHQAWQILLDQSSVLSMLIHPHGHSIRRDSDPLSNQQLLNLGLTPRQAEVMHLMIRGKETSTIALNLGCREATVRKHLENVYRRLGVQTRTAAIAYILGKMGVV